MIDLHCTISEYLDITDEQVDALTPAEVRFVRRIVEAFNEYQRLTMPEPRTPETILRDCLKSLAPMVH